MCTQTDRNCDKCGFEIELNDLGDDAVYLDGSDLLFHYDCFISDPALVKHWELINERSFITNG